MNKYLLLRDNKQSGPFTATEMIAKGIKAYDLVWLEGKSAAWRYPSEIEELKPYAPAVEEQPYDRFYKKDSAAQTGNTLASDAAGNASANSGHSRQRDNIFASGQNSHTGTIRTDAIKRNEDITEDHSAYQPKPRDIHPQKIYINFPASGPSVSNKRGESNEEEKMGAASAAYLVPEPLPGNVNEKSRNASPAVGWNTPAFSWGASSIPNAAATDLKKGFFFWSYTTWIIASCLVLAGILIGLIISNIGQHKNMKDLDGIIKQIQEREKQKIQTTAAHTAWTGNADNEPVDGKDRQPSSAHEAIIAKDKRQPAVGIIPVAAGRITNDPLDEPASIAPKPLPAQDTRPVATKASAASSQNNRQPNAQQPEKTVLHSAAEENPGIVSHERPAAADREDLYKQVSVKAGKYKTGILGGVSALQLEVTNGSPYTLQLVEVQVNYLGLEKKLIRSQNVYFKNISPGESLAQEVPKSGRGVYVEYMISRID